jgi:predicted O-linked N-acetylglucosamine transferase (SPINDLY family)
VLKAAGVPEFAVGSVEDYKALALRLANDREALAQYRARLESVQASPLLDASGLARALESAYARMAQIARAGQRPVSFAVAE